jgi:hypothetical protein
VSRLRLAPALAAVVALATLAAPAPATAGCGPNAAIGSPRIEAPDAERRLAWIDAALARGARPARYWVWGWGIALGVGTVANLAPVPFVRNDERVDWYTGAVTTGVGIVPLLVAPPKIIADARDLHAQLAARAGVQRVEDVCALLTDAETRLVRDAENQADGRRWWVHAANVVLNAGVGLFLIVGFHHWGAGIWNAASGAAIGEVIIFTQPTGAIDSLRRYREGDLDGGAAPTSVSFSRTF